MNQQNIRIFMAVVEHGSIAAAALRLPPSQLSIPTHGNTAANW